MTTSAAAELRSEVESAAVVKSEEKGAAEQSPKKAADLVESSPPPSVDAGSAPEKATDSVEEEKKEVDEAEEAPQKVIALQAMVIRQDPKMLFCPDFLNDEEIEHILSLARERWRESTVGTGTGYSDDLKMINKQSRTRTSWSAELDCGQTPMIRDIEHRIAGFAKFPRAHVERLNPLRYAPGQKFDEHHDGGFRPKTVFIYLNDIPADDEGETYFPYLGIKIKPLKGAAVLWPNVDEHGNADMNMRHMGLPPKTATKYGMNCFINMRPINQGF
jgi:prolyl 4-hydroxylase